MTPTLTPTATFDDTALIGDRCDRCGARAKIRVVLDGGMDLTFCGHHAREYDEKLRGVAHDFIDLDEATSDSLN